ncbi:Rrf2 family transcriptional regulator [Limosilactobacillus fermentum]|uniref:Rrf2 family transcriptional regulator n=1 Tax=Limosilactobacillus fermentum TaxID=1613 RepID=UPI003DA614C5
MRLAKDSKEITIYDILEAIEGTRQLFKIHTDFDTTAFQNRESVEKWLQESSKLLYEAEDAMENVLRGVTLDELDKR